MNLYPRAGYYGIVLKICSPAIGHQCLYDASLLRKSQVCIVRGSCYYASLADVLS
jgi:hypothetical protein